MRSSLLLALTLSYSALSISNAAAMSSSSPVAEQAHSPSASKEITFNSDHTHTARDIVNKLSVYHYNKIKFDDELSSDYLDNLIETLDPNKYYFINSDIQSLEKYRHQFDDLIKSGNLTPLKGIVTLYLDRAATQLDRAIKLLDSDDFSFDFTLEESIDFDDESRPWAETQAELDDRWRQRLKHNVLNLVLSDDTAEDARQSIKKRYDNQLQRLTQQSVEDVFEILMNTLAELYDPHTSYMAPRTLETFNINMSLSLEGIGAVLQMDDNHTKVVRLIKAGPADKSGMLKPADKIIAIGQGTDGELVDVIGWRLDDVVDLIRGPKNSVVRLRLIPANSIDSSEYKTIKITRGKVKLEEQSAQKGVVELIDERGDLHKIGIIHIPTFYLDFEAYRRKDPNFKSTTRDVYQLLQELGEENIEGLIVDLRDNGGGSLQEAASLTDLFIDQGPVVQIRQSNNRISRNFNSRLPSLYKGPMIVLTNRLSASASEIFAGAIQDYKRGLIVGSQSFGKGTVQSLSSVHKGQLKITESKFYRVSGESTQHRGVIPDITYPALVDSEEVGESSYETALPWDQIHAVPHTSYYDIASVLPSLIKEHNARKIKDPDFSYFERQSKLILENKQNQKVSLNKDVREKEKKEAEAKALESENLRRTGKGLETFSTIDEWREDTKNTKEAKESLYLDTSISVDDDPLLNEAGYILVDWLNHFKPQVVVTEKP